MSIIADAFSQALGLILSFNGELYQIIGVSLWVSLSAVALAGLLGVPLGVVIGMNSFRGKSLLVQVLNTMMGLPPVVLGLVVLLLLSRQGVLGNWQLLFTPTAMIIAQTALVVPIVAALCHAAVMALDPLFKDSARTLGASRLQAMALVMHETRYGVMAALIAGFGRAIGEVGAVLMVGGNIKGVTRTMTTAIAMQTSMGDYGLALALGLVLLLLAFVINLIFYAIQRGRP